MPRLQELNAWLTTIFDGAAYTIAPASSDASFRRYFRITVDQRTLIAMDAPPPQEDCAPFVHVAQVLAQAGLNVPQVLEQDIARGFLLLSDLGSTTYLDALNADNADELYRDAWQALVVLQAASREDVFPAYDEALLTREMRLFPDWYIAQHLKVELTAAQQAVLDQTFVLLNANILAQGRVYVHRDYHARNLMVTAQNPGVLDFQDAVYGAVSYDLVSLLKDAYIAWDEPRILDWCIRYWQAARAAHLPVPEDFAEFYRDFEWMGAQRHLKVLGIFARLYHRDGKAGYLQDMPRVMHYLRQVCARYIELRPLFHLLNQLEQQVPQTAYTF